MVRSVSGLVDVFTRWVGLEGERGAGPSYGDKIAYYMRSDAQTLATKWNVHNKWAKR